MWNFSLTELMVYFQSKLPRSIIPIKPSTVEAISQRSPQMLDFSPQCLHLYQCYEALCIPSKTTLISVLLECLHCIAFVGVKRNDDVSAETSRSKGIENRNRNRNRKKTYFQMVFKTPISTMRFLFI